jgi:hypothetical protein
VVGNSFLFSLFFVYTMSKRVAEKQLTQLNQFDEEEEVSGWDER